MASVPRLHHNASLQKLFSGWFTPLRDVANSSIVGFGTVDLVEVVPSGDVVGVAIWFEDVIRVDDLFYVGIRDL
jgi:hypothetical protein